MTVVVTCPSCGFTRNVAEHKIPSKATRAVCPRCGRQFGLDEGMGPGTTASRTTAGGDPGDRQDGGRFRTGRSPWERRSDSGLLRALADTVKMAMLKPEALFRSLHLGGSMGEPLAFGLLVGSVGAMFGFFWELLMLSGRLTSLAVPLVGELAMAALLLLMVCVVPLFVVAGLFVNSVVVHMSLLMVGGARNGFAATFNVVAYSKSAKLMNVVPLIGWVVGLVWQMVIQTVGLREIHGISYLRVFCAFLIPGLFLCGAVAVFIAVVGMAGS